MLTKQEKDKIELEERYRQEIKNALPAPKKFSDRIDSPLKLIQGIAVAAGIIFTLLQYRANSRNEREEAARSFQKAFYETQMSIYAEAVVATSTIATAVPQSKEYEEARSKFFQLFWGKMSMFEDKCVEGRMVQFRKLLIKFEQKDNSPVVFSSPCSTEKCLYDSVDQVVLKKASLKLAHQCRIYTITTWLPPEERSSYNLVDSFDCKGIDGKTN